MATYYEHTCHTEGDLGKTMTRTSQVFANVSSLTKTFQLTLQAQTPYCSRKNLYGPCRWWAQITHQQQHSTLQWQYSLPIYFRPGNDHEESRLWMIGYADMIIISWIAVLVPAPWKMCRCPPPVKGDLEPAALRLVLPPMTILQQQVVVALPRHSPDDAPPTAAILQQVPAPAADVHLCDEKHLHYYYSMASTVYRDGRKLRLCSLIAKTTVMITFLNVCLLPNHNDCKI